MYVNIKENKLLSWCEKPYLDYEYVDIDYSTFDPEKYSVVECSLVDISETEEYLHKREQEEKKLLAQLKMTPLDFISCLESLGVSFEHSIEPLLQVNVQARKALTYCQHVYRGNELLDPLCGTFGITAKQLDDLFKQKGF